MGRCARQGNTGSYSQVLLSTSVAADFDLTSQVVEGWDPTTRYPRLAQLRADAGAGEVTSLREMAVQQVQQHEVLARSLTSFYGGELRALDQLLRRYNTPGGMNIGRNGLHIIFCLDESASMGGSWSPFQTTTPWEELCTAFGAFWAQSAAQQDVAKHVSVVQFSHNARITHQQIPLTAASQAPQLNPSWGGTKFLPAVQSVASLIGSVAGPDHGFTPVLIFMSDGAAADAAPAAAVIDGLARQYTTNFASYTVGFGSNAPRTLERMAFANGVQESNNYRVASVGSLAEAFAAVAKSIAPGHL